MLYRIADKCTSLLIRRGIIEPQKKNIFFYGFELWWSTFFCVSFILLWGILFHCLEETVIFLVTFMSIRIPAGGYHAKSYGRCFVLTNCVAVGCIASAVLLTRLQADIVGYCMRGFFLLAFLYIWNKAPVVTKTHPLSQQKIVRNRKYAHLVLIYQLILTGILEVFKNRFGAYTLMVTLCAAALMIKMVKEE